MTAEPGSAAADSAATIAAAVRERRTSAAAVLAAHRERHAATHGRLNALVQPWSEAAAAAERIDRDPRGLLAGVPLSVKECFAVAGLRTTLGIEGRRHCVDTAAAWLVSRLEAAGAVVVGKANVPQAMYLHETDNPVWGRTNHPFAAARGPGGSSGGDAALVAAGVVPLALGNDLAGSLRQPAHACGIATIMPRSTALGDGGAFDTMPHLTLVRPRAGFLARSTADLELACRAVAAAGSTSGGQHSGAGLRIGWWDDAGPLAASPAVARGVAEAVAAVEAAGGTAIRLDPRIAREAAWLHLAILAADGGRQVRSLFGATRPIRGVARLLRLAALPRAVRPWVAPLVRLAGRRLEAEALLATGPRDEAELAAAAAAQADVASRFAAVAAGCDAILCPVSAVPALRHGTAAMLILAAAPCLLANLLDLAAGAVPVTTVRPDEEAGRRPARDPVEQAACATDRGSAGLPIGVQVIAGPGRDEATVLRVMQLIERGVRVDSR